MTLSLFHGHRVLLMGMTLGVMAWLGGQGSAQEAFPSRPIDFVIPLPPGGVADLHARALAPMMEKILKQPVLVVNKPGSVSKVGTQYVLTREPDGYTLLMAMPSFFSVPEVDRLFGRPMAFERGQFTPLARLSADPLLVYVLASSPWKSIADLVTDARRQPGLITFSSSGLYSSLQLLMEIFAAKAGIKLLHVPYQGGGSAMTALLGGHANILANSVNTGLAQVKAGTIRVLATSGAKRIEALPEVPTFKEQGYDIEFYLPVSVVVRKETPQKATQILVDAVARAAKDAAFKSAMAKVGTPVTYLGGDDLEKFWRWQEEVMITAVHSAWKTK